MESIALNNSNHQDTTVIPSKNNSFIEGNTLQATLKEIQRDHVIPVFVKDNEPAISHAEFIEIVSQASEDMFGVQESSPAIRVSHPIKGRTPEARNKRAAELLDHEKTLYYERMAFLVELDNVHQNIDGNLLKLTVGGVKSYNEDNFSNSKGVDEHFKVFIGFKNTVCTNLCVWSDGFSESITARSNDELYNKVIELIKKYDAVTHISELQRFSSMELSESDFAHVIGRCRLYNYLPVEEKKAIPHLKLNDTIIGKVAESFYHDSNFKMENNHISLWRLFNLFTGATKTSYIDTFLSRNANAHDFVKSLADAVENRQRSWFLN
jgi:hypothetical protein